MRVLMGQSSRRFLSLGSSKPLVLAGVLISENEGLLDNNDGDVILQALCQALASIIGFSTFIKINKELIEKDGITDSVVLLERCLTAASSIKITQVSFSIEAKGSLLFEYVEPMQVSLAKWIKLPQDRIGFSIYEGAGLTDVSCGDGLHVLCAVTIQN